VQIAVGVVPAPVLADEAAGFVQPVAATADPIAGDELDGRVRRIVELVAFDLETQPFGRVVGQIEFARPASAAARCG